MRVLMGALATGSELMDHRIHDENGRPVASINDVVTSLVTGESPYLLLDTEWGLRPVPMEAFRLLGQSGRIQLAGTAAVLRQAPGIASRANVDLTEPGWDEEIRTYWTDSDVLVALRPGMRIVPGTVVRATRVAGLRVINTFGFAAGRITDFLFTADGDVPYALLDLFTDPTGENARFPVPLSAFTIDRNKTYAVTGLDRESMTRLPSLPDGGLEDLSWEGPVAAFWSDRYDLRFEARGERLVSFDAQIGKEVRLRNGDAVGEVAEVILDIEEGQVLYPVVQISAGLGLTRRVPIPLSHIRLESDRIVILAERDDLTEAPTFEDQPWPEIARVGWDQDVREYWSEIGR
jgi:sporulation protein YlmC with PRC-barrel domain